MMKCIALCCLFALASTSAFPTSALAQDASASQRPPPPTAAQQQVMNTEMFLGAHPDLRWRREGLQSLEEGRDAEALTRFKRAARHADKPSQAMVAEMLWTGWGTAVDRPLAYAWMDVAAERAYVPFVVKREQYWKQLSEAERAQALDVGRAVYDEYRDDVAKPRLERWLRRAMRNVTGSRTGFVGALQVIVPGPGGIAMTIDGSKYYDGQYWQPEQYWAWQDSLWKDPQTGHVDVLPLETIHDEADAAPETSSDADSDVP